MAASKSERLSSRLNLPDRNLFLGRARLFADQIELSGWSLKGRIHRVIEIGGIRKVEWYTAVKGEPNLQIIDRLGTEHFIRVQAAGTWCYELRKLSGLSKGSAALPAPRSRRRIADAA